MYGVGVVYSINVHISMVSNIFWQQSRQTSSHSLYTYILLCDTPFSQADRPINWNIGLPASVICDVRLCEILTLPGVWLTLVRAPPLFGKSLIRVADDIKPCPHCDHSRRKRWQFVAFSTTICRRIQRRFRRHNYIVACVALWCQ